MEWLIEHVDDPTADAPLVNQEAPGASAGAGAAASASGASASGPISRTSEPSSAEEAKQDELTEIFKRIRRKREFRPDSRVRGWKQVDGNSFSEFSDSEWDVFHRTQMVQKKGMT